MPRRAQALGTADKTIDVQAEALGPLAMSAGLGTSVLLRQTAPEEA